jgi:hypothetical protein
MQISTRRVALAAATARRALLGWCIFHLSEPRAKKRLFGADENQLSHLLRRK